MRKIFQSPNALHNFRNLMFGFYLLVVSVSLPVLCFVQVGYPDNKADSKESNKVNNNSVKENQPTVLEQKSNTVNFSQIG